jgi:hypothetical protein|tara:strand:+ start:196 stop:1404 length:1209 start_codon:yes stop_codon:yes gene_type:complete
MKKIKLIKRKVKGYDRYFANPRDLIPRKMNKDIYTNEDEEKRTQHSIAEDYKKKGKDGLVPNEQPIMIWPDGTIDAGHTRREGAIIADVEEVWVVITDKPKSDPDKPYSEIQSVTSSNIYRKMTPSVKLQEYTLSEKAYFDEYGINRPKKERDEHIKKLDTCKQTLDQLAVIKREKPELLSKIDNQEMSIKGAYDDAMGVNKTKVYSSPNLKRDWSEIYTGDIFTTIMNRIYNTLQRTLGIDTMINGEEFYPFREFTTASISAILSHLTEHIGAEVLRSEGHDVTAAGGDNSDPDIRHNDIDDRVEIKVTKFDGSQTKWKSGRAIREGQYILISYSQELDRYFVLFTQLLEKDFTKSGSGIMSGHVIKIKDVYENHKDSFKEVYGEVYEDRGKIVVSMEKIK